MNAIRYTVIASLSLVLCQPWATADVIVQEFTDAKEWKDTVDQFSTIDFVGLEHFVPLNDQYADMGITFGSLAYSYQTDSFHDGYGAISPGVHPTVRVFFDEPQNWFAFDHPVGVAGLRLYSEGIVIYDSPEHTFPEDFAGIVSSVSFDEAAIYRPATAGSNMFVDDIHWGVPSPGAIVLFAITALIGRSRRRPK